METSTGMKVYIEGYGGAYVPMFQKAGFEVVGELCDAELVCFTGGEDVCPAYYGEEKHPTTFCSPVRDAKCYAIYNHCIQNELPMVGICRGSQFLCVANGGGLWQHVDNHAIQGSHKAVDSDGVHIDVTSTHHQMMRPEGIEGVDYEILLTAYESTTKYGMVGAMVNKLSSCLTTPDVEAVMWKGTRSFGFQPHPEFESAPQSCTQWFFNKLNLLLEEV